MAALSGAKNHLRQQELRPARNRCEIRIKHGKAMQACRARISPMHKRRIMKNRRRPRPLTGCA